MTIANLCRRLSSGINVTVVSSSLRITSSSSSIMIVLNSIP